MADPLGMDIPCYPAKSQGILPDAKKTRLQAELGKIREILQD